MPPACRQPTPITATSSPPCWRTLPGFPMRAERNIFSPQPKISPPARCIIVRYPSRKHPMQNLSPRHVKTEESLRLGVESGWYSTKVSGTFVTGPHATEADCRGKILELNPPPAKRRVV